jgi:hypothetical protein
MMDTALGALMNKIESNIKQHVKRLSAVNVVSPIGEPLLFSMEVFHGK